ncbi:hypothetical protein HHI36_007865, partial [Cryptolaemus montrouzieri]
PLSDDSDLDPSFEPKDKDYLESSKEYNSGSDLTTTDDHLNKSEILERQELKMRIIMNVT